MSDFATLVLGADTRGLDRGVTSLESVVKAGGKAETAAGGVAGKLQQVGNNAATATPRITAAARATSAVHDAALSAARSLGVLAAGFVSAQAISAAVTQARGFNAALAETSTLIEGTPEEMQALSDGARELAVAFGTDAKSQVQAFYQAISAGAGSVAEAQALLETANQLAVGGVTSVTTAVDILTTATNVYTAEGLLAAEASDALFVAMKAGKTTIPELASSLGKVLPLSQALGVSFDETAGAVAALTKSGLATAEAVTGIRAAMTAVLGPSAEAEKLAAQLGINFNAAGLEAQGFAAFMADVVEKTGGSTEKMQQLFGSVEAVGAALSFSGGAGQFMAEIMGQMGEKAGATQTAFEKINESLDGRLNRAVAALSDIMLALGGALLTVLVPALEAVAATVGFVVENADTFGYALAFIAATQIPAFLIGLTSVVTGFLAYNGIVTIAIAQTVALTAASTAMAAAAALATRALAFVGGPITLAVAAVGGLALALTNTTAAATTLKEQAAETAVKYAEAAVSAGMLTQPLLDWEDEGEKISTYMDEILVSSGGVTEEAQKHYAWMVATRQESEVALATAQDMLSSQLQQNEIARLSAVYGENSLQVTQARQAAELEVLRAQLQTLPISDTMRSNIIAAAQAGYDLANAAGIAAGQISSAAGEAARLAANLGAAAVGAEQTATRQLSIINSQIAAVKSGQDELVAGKVQALELDKIAYRNAQLAVGLNAQQVAAATEKNFAAQEALIAAESELQAAQKLRTETDRLASSGGAAGVAVAAGAKEATAALDDTTRSAEELQAALKAALIDARSPQEEFNAGMAELNELAAYAAAQGVDFGDAYADGFKKLQQGLASSMPMVNDLIGALTDGLFNGFDGTLDNILSIFKSWLADMIKTALINAITIPVNVATGSGSSDLSGLFSGITTGFTDTISSFGSALFGSGGLTDAFGAATAGMGELIKTGFSAGASLGQIGAAIGAIAVPVLAVIGIFSAFKTTTTVLDAGLRVTIDGLSAVIETYEKVQKSSFFGPPCVREVVRCSTFPLFLRWAG